MGDLNPRMDCKTIFKSSTGEYVVIVIIEGAGEVINTGHKEIWSVLLGRG